jgi:hypothetical protein
MTEKTISFGAIEEMNRLNNHNPKETDPNKFHYNNFPDGSPMTKQNIKTGQMWIYAGPKDNPWVDVMTCKKDCMLLWWGVPREINGEIVW